MNEINIIKDRLIELNMSQYQLAKATGISAATISRWLAGKHASIELKRFKKILKALDLVIMIVPELKQQQ